LHEIVIHLGPENEEMEGYLKVDGWNECTLNTSQASTKVKLQ